MSRTKRGDATLEKHDGMGAAPDKKSAHQLRCAPARREGRKTIVSTPASIMSQEPKRSLRAGLQKPLSTEELKVVAGNAGLLYGGKVDLRGQRVTMTQHGLDLREILFEDAELVKCRLTSCVGEEVSFNRAHLQKTWITAARGDKISFREATFDNAIIDESEFGPRTFDLTGTTWRGARLSRVTFMLARLTGADFTGAELTDVYFRSGLLEDVSFRGASLTRVDFSGATLTGANFSGASFHEMEFWGEPDYAGALIDDELRYQYGELKDPLRRVEALTDRDDVPEEMKQALRRLIEKHRDLLSWPECMLIGHELADIIPPALFPRLLKTLKEQP